MLENLVIGTNRGALLVRGMPPRFLREDPAFEHSQIVAHEGEVTALKASVDGKLLFSAGTDGIIFVYEVVEHTPTSGRRPTLLNPL